MSQQQQPEHEAEQAGAAPSMSTPSLSEYEAAKAREEALERPPHVGEAISGAHGRVEEATRQLSERMTREERERRKALALTKTAPLITPPTPTRQLPEPMPIHSMLVALDGTPFAERAVPYAAALGRLTGSAITVGLCARPTGAAAQPANAIEEVTRVDGSLNSSERVVRQMLLDTSDHLHTQGLSAHARIVHASDVTEGLLALSERIGAEALALATHARAGVGRAVLGSVADEVVRLGRGLTLVVPPLAPDASHDGVVFERALVPLDGSSLSEQTLRVIQPMLQREPAGDDRRWLRSLTLFFVAEDQAQVRDAEVYLHDLRDALLHVATAPTEITAQVLLGSAPGAIVARAAGEHPMPPTRDERHDLIIMATHGRSGAGRWFYGSVATYVLAHSAVPVLLVRTAQ